MELLLMGLLIASTLTSLLTEALKKLCVEHQISNYANTLAGLSAFVVAVALDAVYIAVTDTAITPQVIVGAVALVFLSWLCAMVGYDKVIQAIKQITNEGDSK
jgi:hypothetical protein